MLFKRTSIKGGLCAFALALSGTCVAQQPPPPSQNRSPLPVLHAAYAHLYEGALKQYAITQGFDEPHEMAGTVAHELIHIAQAHKGGFYMPDPSGETVENFQHAFVGPYITQPIWGSYTLPTNEQVMSLIRPPGPMDQFIPRNYGNQTPGNTLLNIVDEINAYRLTAPWICERAEIRCAKQVRNLEGHLEMAAWHLYFLRTRDPSQGVKLAQSEEGAFLFEVIGLGIQALKSINGSAPLMEREGSLWR